MKSHYVYLLLHPSTNEFYIGVRSCIGDPLYDKYMGSMVSWKVNKDILNKYIIRTFSNRCDAEQHEIDLLKIFIKDPLNRNYFIPTIGFGSYGKKPYNKLNTKIFIEKSKLVHNDKYEYNKSIYIDSKTNIIITCREHGDFLQKPEKHMVGQGCKECYLESNKRPLYDNNYYIDKFNRVHNNLYTYDNFIYISQFTKSIITCRKHGDFLQTPKAHMRGQGCKKCAGEYSSILNKFVKGYSYISGRKKPYKVVKNKRFIGYFSTEQEAINAYLTK